MSTDLHTLTPEQLAAMGNDDTPTRARAELERRQNEHADRLAAAIADWERSVLAKALDLDVMLEEQAKAAEATFNQAVLDRDLPAAFAAWIEQRSTRTARRIIRDDAAMAEDRQHTGTRILPELRYYNADLLQRLQDAADKAATILGADTAEALIGVSPTEVD